MIAFEVFAAIIRRIRQKGFKQAMKAIITIIETVYDLHSPVMNLLFIKEKNQHDGLHVHDVKSYIVNTNHRHSVNASHCQSQYSMRFATL